MKKYKIWIGLIVVVLIGINGLLNFPESLSYSESDFFNNTVKTSYNRSYNGIVVRKYNLNQGIRDKIVINKNGIETELDYVYEKQNIYKLIKVGDSLIKRKGQNSIIIKNASFDTIINLKFDNIRGVEHYSENNEFLNE